MTPAQRIREVALGASPRDAASPFCWVGSYLEPAGEAVMDTLDWAPYGAGFTKASNTERRMFLLFVAEALENE